MLLPGGGLLIDTPGMRELQLWDSGRPVAETFADIARSASAAASATAGTATSPAAPCRAAVAAGELPESRLESYRKLHAEQEHAERQQDERALIEGKRRGDRREGAPQASEGQGRRQLIGPQAGQDRCAPRAAPALRAQAVGLSLDAEALNEPSWCRASDPPAIA